MPQYELNIRDYWQIIQKRRWVFIVIFFIVLTLIVIYTNSQKPIYRAAAAVQWTERRTLGGLLTELVIERSGDPLATQARIITSLPVIEKVAVELGLVTENAGPGEIMEKALAIQGAVSTNILADTSIIRILANHANPQMAAKIANKVAEVYIVENRKEKAKQSRSVREFIEKQLQETTAKLKESEEALAKFKEQEAPSGIALSLQNKLMELETKRQDLLKRYTPKYPEVINTEDEIKRIKKEFQGLPQKELEFIRLSRTVEIDTSLYRQLQDKLAAARITEAENVEDVSIVERATVPGSPIKPNKPLNYLVGIAIGIVLAFTATSLVEQLDTSIGTIEDVENFLKLPALGVIPYLKTEDEKKKNFIQKLWPKEVKGKDKALRLRSQLIIHYSSSSPISEAYKILRTNIQTEILKDKIQGKIVLFTSSAPEEGKSITISNLAIAMAQGGLRTLLLDADMRRPVIHNIFGFQGTREPGLCNILRESIDYKNTIRTVTDMLTGEIAFDEVLKMPGIDNLNIITSGSLPALPAELLSSVEMANLLTNLRTKFDIILVDSPPVLAVADATILAPKTDGVILVYRVGKTSRSVLARSKTQLSEAGAQVKGVVLNNISPEIEMRYGYYYHYKYYGKYYTEKKPEAET